MNNIDSFIYVPWEGIVESNEHNETPELTNKPNSHGVRYRIRIKGVHDEKTPLTSLPVAEVIFPVTAGSGLGAAGQTANLKRGSIVSGYYRGPNKTQPVIIGTVPNYFTTELGKSIWNPGYGFSSTANIPDYSRSVDGKAVFAQSSILNTINVAGLYQYKDGKEESRLPSSCDETVPLGQIQKDIKKITQAIENEKRKLRKNRANFAEVATKYVSDTIKGIADDINNWITENQKNVTEKIREKSAEILYNLFPVERIKTEKPLNTFLDLLNCMFKKASNGIFSMLTKAFSTIIDRIVNAPFCLVSNFITSVLGKLTGMITNSITALLGPLDSVLNGIISVVDDILTIFQDIFSFISCADEPYCPELKSWSIWEGPRQITGSIEGLSGRIKSIADEMGDLNIDNLSDTLNLDFNDVLQDSCNVGPLFCGTPFVEIFGGGGYGATGNAIIGQGGQILGIDITSPGSGYQGTPNVSIIDACGIGKGAVAVPVLGPIPILPPDVIFTGTRIDFNKYKLEWSTRNAVRLESNFGVSDLSGSTIVSPNNKTIYTITAYNRNDALTTQSIVIDPADNVQLDNFDTIININPELTFSSLYIKDNIYKLIWTTNNVIRVSSNFGISQDVLNGNKEVSPSVPTIYSITAYDADGLSITKTILLNPKVITPPTQKEETDPNVQCPTSPVIPKFDIAKDLPPDEIGVVKIIIKEAGRDYLSAPDGRLGGDGRVWAEKNETYVRRVDGTYDIPYAPGSVIQLDRCDKVYPPCEPMFVAQEKSVYIAPECDRTPPKLLEKDLPNSNFSYPTLENGKYPVILYLCDTVIVNRGFGYSQNDKLKIEPSNGAEISPTFNSNGELESIKIISGGEGFTTRPVISIESTTGFNANIIPVMCIDRIGAVDFETVPYKKDKVLHVVDCPGNIYA